MSVPRLAVVVLTWNGRDDTIACLDSLRGQTQADDAVIVCDNGSTDGTLDAIAARHPQVRVLANGANLGFAGGNNPGLRHALERGFRWVLLLNNDTIVPEGALSALLAHAERATEFGAFQPLLVRASDPDVVDGAGHVIFRCPGAVDGLHGRPVAQAPSSPTEVFGACAAAALLRADVLAQAGLLDEALFVLCEDVDLMFRIRLAGHRVQLVPSVRVLHRRGVSGRPASAESARRRRFWLARNTVALALRYWPATWLVLASPVLLVRALQAALLPGAPPGTSCLPLWSSSCRARAANRRGMRRLGIDRWFTVRP